MDCPFCERDQLVPSNDHHHYCLICNRWFDDKTLNRIQKIEILKRYGYTITSDKPLEIKDHTGSIATGNFVDIVVGFLQNEDEEPVAC